MVSNFRVQEIPADDQPRYQVIDEDGIGRVCFCEELEHAERIAKLLNQFGVETDYDDGL